MSVEAGLHPDFLDLLEAFSAAGVDFIVVGAHALAAHGASTENAKRVIIGLRSFGAPLDQHGVTAADFERAGTVYQMGLPPRRIDVLTQISGVTFEEAWPERTFLHLRGSAVGSLGRAALLKNERTAARAKDLVDVELLERQRG